MLTFQRLFLITLMHLISCSEKKENRISLYLKVKRECISSKNLYGKNGKKKTSVVVLPQSSKLVVSLTKLMLKDR